MIKVRRCESLSTVMIQMVYRHLFSFFKERYHGRRKESGSYFNNHASCGHVSSFSRFRRPKIFFCNKTGRIARAFAAHTGRTQKSPSSRPSFAKYGTSLHVAASPKSLEAAYIMYRIKSKARCVTKALSAAV